MVFTRNATDNAIDGYRSISAYFADVRSFYEVIAARLAAGEYGISLVSVQRQQLFASTDSYSLAEATSGRPPGDPGACPAYIWFPTWLGAFYMDPGRFPGSGIAGDYSPGSDIVMAFVWIWIGLDDAYVADAPEPQCWFGVTKLNRNGADSAHQAATKVWRFFRVEWTKEDDVEGWMTGRFQKNSIGCDLDGAWYLRRTGISALASYYSIEKLVVRPLAEKYAELIGAENPPGWTLATAPTVPESRSSQDGQ